MKRARRALAAAAALIVALSAALAFADTTVYITDTGKKYHNAGCRFLNKSKHAISQSEAERQGYEPCKVCGG